MLASCRALAHSLSELPQTTLLDLGIGGGEPLTWAVRIPAPYARRDEDDDGRLENMRSLGTVKSFRKTAHLSTRKSCASCRRVRELKLASVCQVGNIRSHAASQQVQCSSGCLARQARERAAAGPWQQSRTNVSRLLEAFEMELCPNSISLGSDLCRESGGTEVGSSNGHAVGANGAVALESTRTGPHASDDDRRAHGSAKSRVLPDHAIALASLKVLGGTQAGGAAPNRTDEEYNDSLAEYSGAGAHVLEAGHSGYAIKEASVVGTKASQLPRDKLSHVQSAGTASAHGFAWSCSKKLAIARSLMQQNGSKGAAATVTSHIKGAMKRLTACTACRKAKVCTRQLAH